MWTYNLAIKGSLRLPKFMIFSDIIQNKTSSLQIFFYIVAIFDHEKKIINKCKNQHQPCQSVHLDCYRGSLKGPKMRGGQLCYFVTTACAEARRLAQRAERSPSCEPAEMSVCFGILEYFSLVCQIFYIGFPNMTQGTAFSLYYIDLCCSSVHLA